jgi:hypothetical protein
MSFDVYVGTFTRYITGDWENAGQQDAREQGIPYQLIRADETEEAPPPTEDVRAAVESWLDGINQGLKNHLPSPLDWDESERSPYFTERPGWAAYAALLLHAAYTDHPEMARPEKLPEEWGEDAAYKASTADESDTQYPALLAANLWLPGEFEFMFGVEDLGGNERAIASCAALLSELRELNARTFALTDEALRSIRTEPIPRDAGLDDLAKAGLAHFIGLAGDAVNHQLPMMLDY